MKCDKQLFLCLILQTLLIIGGAGKKTKTETKTVFKPLPSTSNAESTNAWGIFSGRVSPSKTNVGRRQARSPSPQRLLVQPGPPGVSAGQRVPLNPRVSSPPGIPRSSEPSEILASAYPPLLQAPGTHARPRIQSPVTPVQPVYQSPDYHVQPVYEYLCYHVQPVYEYLCYHIQPVYQSPGYPVQPRPQSTGYLVWSRPQSPDSKHSVPHQFNEPSVSSPQSPTTNSFPALPQPKVTYSEAERQHEFLKSQIAGSTSSRFSSHSGRSSMDSTQSKATQVLESTASPETCRDSHDPVPFVAPAKNCFDYFKLAVIWSPGYAYQQWLEGKEIRKKKISPNWIIHGLWPTMFDRKKNPMPLCSRFDIFFNQNHLRDNKLLSTLDNTWYTILDKDFSDNSRFWENQFKKHGSCATRSSVIKNDVGYFKRTIELFQKLNIATTLFNNKIKPGMTIELGKLIDAIEDKIKAKIFVKFIADRDSHQNIVTEMHICYDIDLLIMDCPKVFIPDNLWKKPVKLLERLHE